MTCLAPCDQTTIQDEAALDDLADQWQSLLDQSYDNRLFLLPQFARLWWRRFGAGQARIVGLWEAGALIGLLPLHLRGQGDRRVLSLLGDHNVADYLDAMAIKSDADSILERLWRCALSDLSFDLVELRHVPCSSPLLRALESAGAELGLRVTIEPDEVCPVAILCSSWEGYLETLTKKQRHEVRRKLRRATEGVPWEWHTVTCMDELHRDLPEFFRLHEASAHDKAEFMTEQMEGFFWDVATAFLERGQLRLSILRREGEGVAANFGFLYRGRYLLYNSGYDPSFAHVSPGIAAVALSMQDAIAEKAIAFDFMSGDEPYKYQFGATDTHTCRATVTR